MNRKVLILTSFLMVFCASVVLAQTTEVRTVKVRTEVVNDFPSATEYLYSVAERDFLESVPEADGLRQAVDQMVRGGLIHVPTGGRYAPGTSTRYWSMYQVWTAKKVAEFDLPVLVVQGPPGPQGPQGPAGQVIYLPAPVVLPGTHHMVGSWATTNWGWLGWAWHPSPSRPTPLGEQPCSPGEPPAPPPVPQPPCPR